MLKKRKTYAEKCPVCGSDIHPRDNFHPLSEDTVYFDELPPDVTILAEVNTGHWVKVIERRPAKA